MGMKDIHSHFVYGVDDGAKTAQDMYDMLDAAWADGITTLYATPHVTPGVQPFDQDVFQAHLAEARQYCLQKSYSLTLHPGAEILFTPALVHYLAGHRLPALAETTVILLEFLPDIALHELLGALDCIQKHGYSIVLAHMERYGCLQKHGIARKIKSDYDVSFQLNAHTLLTKRSFFQQRRIQHWIRDGLVDFIASDAHDPIRRPFCMSAGYHKLLQLCGEETAARLTGR